MMKQSKELKGLLLISVAIFLGIVFYFQNLRSGFLGTVLLQFSQGLIGKLAFISPLVFLLLGLNIIFEKKNTFNNLKIINICIFFIFTASLFQIFTVDFKSLEQALLHFSRSTKDGLTATNFLRLLWHSSYDVSAYPSLNNALMGGVFGGTLAFSLTHILGKVGAILFIIVSLLSQGILIFNLSYLDFFRNTKKYFGDSTLVNKVSQVVMREEKKHERAKVEGQRGQKGVYDNLTLKEWLNEKPDLDDDFLDQKNSQKDPAYQQGQAYRQNQIEQTTQTDQPNQTIQTAQEYSKLLQKWKKNRNSSFRLLLKEKSATGLSSDLAKKEKPQITENGAKEDGVYRDAKIPHPAFAMDSSEVVRSLPKLNPTRMVNPVPIGKVLSQDPEWEKPEPLEEDLKVKRISVEDTNNYVYRSTPIPERSNLEILAEQEPSLTQVSVPKSGVFYGLTEGKQSNLQRSIGSPKQEFSSEETNSAFTFEFDSSTLERTATASLNSQVESVIEQEENILKENKPEEGIFEKYNQGQDDFSKNKPEENKPPQDNSILSEQENTIVNVQKSDYGSSVQLKNPKEPYKQAMQILPHTEEKEANNYPGSKEASVEETMLKRGLINKKSYVFPPTTFLQADLAELRVDEKVLEEQAAHLEKTLSSFGVSAEVIHVTTGPSITRFELAPGSGVKVSKIVGLADDIALSLAAVSVRIEAPIPGKSAVGIEIPNKETLPVHLRDLLETKDFREAKSPLTVALGRDIAGDPVLCDLAKMPHLLIAGSTGSGKSVCINCILTSILYKASPDDVKLILVDPKVVELKIYNSIPHLITPVVTDPKKAANALNWAVNEMTRRYQLFANKVVRDIKSYNENLAEGEEKLPYILIVIDELADLMSTAAKEVEDSISRLTAMARACGMHLLVATQRPSVDVLTGVIKSNIPSRIAFSVSSQIDSRTILDGAGAEKLLGKGDMLYAPTTSPKSLRAQGAFVSDTEVEQVTQFIKEHNEAIYDDYLAELITSAGQQLQEKNQKNLEEDADLAYVPAAMEIILASGQASTSILQRKLKLGYPRASRIIDYLEEEGIVGPFEGSRPRKLLISREEWNRRKESM